MKDIILCYVFVSVAVSIITYITKGFSGEKEVRTVCSLCLFITVLIPFFQRIPIVIDGISELCTEVTLEPSENGGYGEIEKGITQSVESYAQSLIQSRLGVTCRVSAQMDFSDMSAVKIVSITVYRSESGYEAPIKVLLKTVYDCDIYFK